MEKTVAVAASLVVFIVWESLRPYFAFGKGHALRELWNALVGATDALLGRVLFGGVMAWLFTYLDSNPAGLLSLADFPFPVEIALTLIFLDLWSYWWHRFNHTVSFLWRFHRAHHTDTEMCATSAYRFHPVEILFSSVLRIPLVFALGLRMEGLILYEAVLAVSIAFHHANIGIGSRADSILRLFIVSPVMHKLHHSVLPREFSSNYSSILSVWDRLFGTWTGTDKPEDIKLGLNIFRNTVWQGYWGILRTPFVRSGKVALSGKVDRGTGIGRLDGAE